MISSEVWGEGLSTYIYSHFQRPAVTCPCFTMFLPKAGIYCWILGKIPHSEPYANSNICYTLFQF